MSKAALGSSSKEFLGHLHAFRAIAILYIVAGHALDAFSWDSAPLLGKTIRVFCGNGSSLFVFIAGYLFQHLSRRFNVAEYYRSKLRNVIVPYLIVSVPALVAVASGLLVRWDVPPELTTWPVWERVLWLLGTGRHLSPLWFIPMISIFYLAAPLLVAMDRRPRWYVVWPLLMAVTMVVGRGFAPQSFVHFLSFYVAGMFFSHYRAVLDPWLKKPVLWLPLLLLAVVLGVLQIAGNAFGLPLFALNAWQKLFVCLALLGVLPACTRLIASPKVSELADLSFGLFFIHSYFITGAKLAYSRLVGAAPTGNLLSWMLFTAVVVLLCCAVLRMVKHFAGPRSRWLVGC